MSARESHRPIILRSQSKFEGFWFRLEPVKEFRLAGTVIKCYRYNYLEMKVWTTSLITCLVSVLRCGLPPIKSSNLFHSLVYQKQLYDQQCYCRKYCWLQSGWTGEGGGRYSSKCKIKSGSYLEMWLPLSALDKVASCVEFICTLVWQAVAMVMETIFGNFGTSKDTNTETLDVLLSNQDFEHEYH